MSKKLTKKQLAKANRITGGKATSASVDYCENFSACELHTGIASCIYGAKRANKKTSAKR